jgi:hypothetical protein
MSLLSLSSFSTGEKKKKKKKKKKKQVARLSKWLVEGGG